MTQDPPKQSPSIQRISWKNLKVSQRPWCKMIVIDFPGSLDHKSRECRRKARYLVSGLGMCELHAGQIALDVLLSDQPATPETPLAEQSEKDAAKSC